MDKSTIKQRITELRSQWRELLKRKRTNDERRVIRAEIATLKKALRDILDKEKAFRTYRDRHPHVCIHNGCHNLTSFKRTLGKLKERYATCDFHRQYQKERYLRK